MMLHRLVLVYTCQNTTLLEITCHLTAQIIGLAQEIVTYAKWPLINAHADIYNGARGLSFVQRLLLYPHCVIHSNDCSDYSVHVHINYLVIVSTKEEAKNYRAPGTLVGVAVSICGMCVQT